MRSFRPLAGAAFFLAACASPPAETPPETEAHVFDWIADCWISETGATREVWQIGSNTLVFGFNLVQGEDGETAFFEQLRLEKDAEGWRFAAHPRGIAPTYFEQVEGGASSATFMNTENDYPQRIRYWRDGAGLSAEIALASGERPNAWRFSPCSD